MSTKPSTNVLNHPSDISTILASDLANDIKLSQAIQTQDITTIQYLLDLDPKLTRSHISEDGNSTALHLACDLPPPDNLESEVLQLDIIRHLLQRGADMTARLFHELSTGTPLHLAARQGNTAIVKLLLENGADRTIEEGYQRRVPIETAIATGRVEVVRLLLSNGGEDKRKELLHRAAESGISDIIEVVLKVEGKGDLELRDFRGQTPLLRALWEKRVEDTECEKVAFATRKKAIMLLVNEVANLDIWDDDGRSVFLGAARCGCREIIERLLAEGKGPRSLTSSENFQSSALHLAVENKDRDIVELLIQHGMDVNAKDLLRRSPLHYSGPCEDLVGYDPAGDESKLSRSLIQRSLVEVSESILIAQILLQNGALLDAKDRHGTTTLHLAILNPFEIAFPFICKLIEYGASINTQSSDAYLIRDTPLHSSLRHPTTACLELLLECGADINLKSLSSGNTILFEACQGGKDDFVRVLLKCGANLDERNKHGRTAMIAAAARAPTLICLELMIKAGADMRIVDNEGHGLEYWIKAGEVWRKAQLRRKYRSLADG